MRGDRKIILPQLIIRALRKHQARQGTVKRQVGKDWLNKDLVFCDKRGAHIHLGGNIDQLQMRIGTTNADNPIVDDYYTSFVSD